MPDREKVINGLECCMAEKICDNKCPYKGQCDDGGYYYSKAIEDAIELLKAQELRVLKPNELCNFTFESAWVELKHNEVLTLVEWDKITLLTLLWTIGSWDSYGKLWRCWSAKPTNEQRKAAKWDD